MPPLDKEALARSIVAISYGALVIGRGRALADVFDPLRRIDSPTAFALPEDAAPKAV